MEEIFSFERASSSKSAVAMARRIHLFPCRTQQLSFLTPKVVGGKLPARIGSCRANQESDGSLALFVFLVFCFVFLALCQILLMLVKEFYMILIKALNRTCLFGAFFEADGILFQSNSLQKVSEIRIAIGCAFNLLDFTINAL